MVDLWTPDDDRAPVQMRRMRCEVCSDGWTDGEYIAPDICRSVRCTACDGDGWLGVEFETVAEQDLDVIDGEREAAARAECHRRGIDPDVLCADGGVEAWMVVDREMEASHG